MQIGVINKSDLELFNEFAEAAYLNKMQDPYRIRKKNGSIYANIKIINCKHQNWWYFKYIGIECFAELRFRAWEHKHPILYEAVCCRIVGVYIHTGRSISADDFIIL